MKSNLFLSIILTLAIGIAGCATTQQTSFATPFIPQTGGSDTSLETETPAVAASTDIQVATPTQASTVLPATPIKTLAVTETILTINVNSEGEPAPFLVDGRGRSLYVYMNDDQGSHISSCEDDCAVEWPPVFVTATPAAGPGVDPDLLSTVARADGSLQATYNGWPLYYYNMDTIPGTINAQGYNDVWFLVSPDGAPIQR